MHEIIIIQYAMTWSPRLAGTLSLCCNRTIHMAVLTAPDFNTSPVSAFFRYFKVTKRLASKRFWLHTTVDSKNASLICLRKLHSLVSVTN